jgi:hypothetical protein
MNTSRARVSLWTSAAACMLVLSPGARAQAAPPVGIAIASQTHHVWGQAGGYDPATGYFANSYDLTDTAPVSGMASAPYYVDEPYYQDWVTNTVSSRAGEFLVEAVDGSQWTFTGSWARAHSEYEFTPNTHDLGLHFDGVVAMHAFENWVTFTLSDVTDVDNPISIDTRTWSTEGLPGDSGIVDWSQDYVCDPSHLYELTLYAQVNIGDTPGVTSRLEVTITPEPAAISLALLGGLALARRRR